MSRFNLSEWALRHRGLVLYFMILVAVIGTLSFRSLGQSEDPPFTFKVMVVRTMWPGASAEEVTRQVTDRIEEKLQELSEIESIRSYSRPGESMVFVELAERLPRRDVPQAFYQIRKKIADIRHTLPAEAIGPFFNDEFGDTFGNIFALTGDGFDDAALKDWARRLKLELLRLPGVAKVDLVGLQDEKIFIELDNSKLATLGVSFEQVQATLAAQNAIAPAGFFEGEHERIYLRATGSFDSVESVREMLVRADGQLFRLGDVATVRRGYADPPASRMRYLGRDALGLAVSMVDRGNILELGRQLDDVLPRLQSMLPVGLELEKVADQPASVRASVGEFLRVLAEAVFVVLLVSFFSLGFRTGLVVAISIPLVLAMTFGAMAWFGIDLHKISLGALVLALGLLVDDAIIAVEMMAIKMEQGMARLKAAAFAYTSTAFPMLTGTLITAAGFLPIATAASNTGEYTRSLFQVVTIALLLSWVVAVVFVPWLGHRLLPDLAAQAQAKGHHADPYQRRFYQRYRSLLQGALRHRWLVIAGTVALFAGSVLGFGLVEQQFFPSSTRPELLVDIKLPEGASLKATRAQVEKLESHLAGDEDLVNYVAFVGAGAPRFYLPLDQQLPQASFAQFVLLARDLEARERVRSRLMALFNEDFTEARTRVLRLENGPPVGYPVQFRVSGEDIGLSRQFAHRMAGLMRADPALREVHLDWEEPSKVVRLVIDQDRARAVGVSSQQVATFLQSALTGAPISVYREDNELIDIVLRGDEKARLRLSSLDSLAMPTSHGQTVSLSQVARFDYALEEGIIWRRDRLPTITVRADIADGIQPATVTARVDSQMDALRAELPVGYRIEIGGSVEASSKGQASVNAGMPLFILVVLTVLMFQLGSFQRTLLVVLTAPLGLIGVVAFLLLFRVPFGFVAMLGTIALFGMIMRNSVILVDQIEQDIAAGHGRWQAIVDASVRRFRPIVLTAMTAVLAMIPLSRSDFYGPMAVAIMGGLIVGTALTLVFLPALYAAWFGVHENEPPRAVEDES
ncbi:efflux RND transporter permease subunit [Pseudofulvimonas gallinarii]|uniref:Multidrug efflux pump n=1 Tax=Pseudofulvimonas gallinarii TaxID=634155 RepID=A0A4R3LEM6_9GAMM|nr:efflux RND transporter permease subunit [Pseudofulvimonas gallinarii]TCS98449.1 multidrug efflux pump [Pseudofulvimonas gallinarii]THD13749.1 multidrug transporter AcrB [Pseudofulvimonas gallinarii]